MSFVIMVTALLLPTGIIQETETPGVTEVAPGVRRIEGAKVPTTSVDTVALEALIKETKSFGEVAKLLGGKGIASPGPANTTTHMFKISDQATGKAQVLVLFVRGNAIVDYLIS